MEIRSIWVVLLDLSSSMNEGFSSRGEYDPLAEVGPWRTKLDAAKDILIRQVASAQVQDIAIVTFASDAQKLLQGNKTDLLAREQEIRNLRGQGNTNLKRAFEIVAGDPEIHGYSSVSVLVLSDGLANQGDPTPAAKMVITEYPGSRIDTILIDDTTRGRRQAESVSINGFVRPAFSSDELAYQVAGQHGLALGRQLQQTNTQRFRLKQEIASATGAGAVVRLRERSGMPLTATTLRQNILPYVEAVESLGRVHGGLNAESPGITISSITQDSPVEVIVGGCVEVVRILVSIVVPFMREHQIALQRLEREERELDHAERALALQQQEVELVDRRQQLELDTARRRLELKKIELRESMLTQADGIVWHIVEQSGSAESPQSVIRAYTGEVVAAMEGLCRSDAVFQLAEDREAEYDHRDRR